MCFLRYLYIWFLTNFRQFLNWLVHISKCCSFVCNDVFNDFDYYNFVKFLFNEVCNIVIIIRYTSCYYTCTITQNTRYYICEHFCVDGLASAIGTDSLSWSTMVWYCYRLNVTRSSVPPWRWRDFVWFVCTGLVKNSLHTLHTHTHIIHSPPPCGSRSHMSNSWVISVWWRWSVGPMKAEGRSRSDGIKGILMSANGIN